MRERGRYRDGGLVSPAILATVIAFTFLVAGLLQIGLSADRSSRVQIAADAAALAAASAALVPAGGGTPAAVGRGAGDPRGAAVEYATRNLPGLDAGGVEVTVEGREVTVELTDTRVLSRSPLGGLRTPENRAIATATLDEDCDDEAGTPAAPGAGCDDPDYHARLVD